MVTHNVQEEDLKKLRSGLGQAVTIACIDGEVIVGRVLHLWDDGVVFDIISTNRLDKYEKEDVQPAYFMSFANIVSVKE